MIFGHMPSPVLLVGKLLTAEYAVSLEKLKQWLIRGSGLFRGILKQCAYPFGGEVRKCRLLRRRLLREASACPNRGKCNLKDDHAVSEMPVFRVDLLGTQLTVVIPGDEVPIILAAVLKGV